MLGSLKDALQKYPLSHIPEVVIEHSLASDVDELVASLLPRAKFAVIDDFDTANAFGHRVSKALQKFGGMHITLGPSPLADDANVAYVRERSSRCDVLVAVGSGTVNDICKYAAAQEGKPYIAVPTAASMNGYLSANASITIQGYKQTVPAKMPVAVLCDMSVIGTAPVRLARSGLGDSLARSTAQADWLMSHLLLGTEYDDTPFSLLTSYEPMLFEQARGVALGDKEAMRLLIQVLLLSGLGMTVAGGSYPASQAEHMIAHTYNMLSARRGMRVSTLHGEEVGVTTLDMARAQEALFQKTPILRMDAFNEEAMTVLFGAHAAKEAKKAYEHKRERMQDTALSKSRWQDIAERVSAMHLPSAQIEMILKKSESPMTVPALGWDAAMYEEAKSNARFLRDRFTVLDLKA